MTTIEFDGNAINDLDVRNLQINFEFSALDRDDQDGILDDIGVSRCMESFYTEDILDCLDADDIREYLKKVGQSDETEKEASRHDVENWMRDTKNNPYVIWDVIKCALGFEEFRGLLEEVDSEPYVEVIDSMCDTGAGDVREWAALQCKEKNHETIARQILELNDDDRNTVMHFLLPEKEDKSIISDAASVMEQYHISINDVLELATVENLIEVAEHKMKGLMERLHSLVFANKIQDNNGEES